MIQQIITESEFQDFLKTLGSWEKNKIIQCVNLGKKNKYLIIIRHLDGARSIMHLIPPLKYNSKKLSMRLKPTRLNYKLDRGVHIILGRDEDIEKIREVKLEENRPIKRKSAEPSISGRSEGDDLPVQKTLQKVQRRVKRTARKPKKRKKKNV